MSKSWFTEEDLENRCFLCAEPENPVTDPLAEMFDPNKTEPSRLVHADCGLSNGWEIA